MPKKHTLFLAVFTFILAIYAQNVNAESQSDLLASADALYEKGNYTEALGKYESLYNEGFFSEKMLYRLAYMQEQLKNYPLAIYYLKKIRLEFGGDQINQKIKQLVQQSGGLRFFTEDGWDNWIRFVSGWGWMILLLFLLGMMGILIFNFTNLLKTHLFRKYILGTFWILFVISSSLILIDKIFTPENAVIIAPTSYYQFPSFASKSSPDRLSLGETVKVTDRKDIWVEVSAGGQFWWIPERCLKNL